MEITQGCTHNRCKFCTMYKEVPFRMSPMEWIEEDLKELGMREISLGVESGDDWTLEHPFWRRHSAANSIRFQRRKCWRS